MAQKWVLDQPMMSMVNPNTGVPNSLYQDPASQLIAMFSKNQPEALATPMPIDMQAPMETQRAQQVNSKPMPQPEASSTPSELPPDMQEIIMRKMLARIDSPEAKAARAEQKRLSDEALASQQEGVNENEKALKAFEQQGNRIDLSPLLALTDSWTGSNLSRGYAPPPTPEAYAKQLLAMKQGIQAQKRDIAQERLNALQRLAGGDYSKELMDIWKTSGQADRSENRLSYTKEKEISDSYSKALKNMDDAGSQFNLIEQALANPNTVNINVLSGQIARAIGMEKGVLTDNDISRIVPQDFQRKLAEFESRMTGEKIPLTSKNLAELAEVARQARKYARLAYENKIKSINNEFSKRPSYKGMQDAVGSMFQVKQQALNNAFGSGAPILTDEEERQYQEDMKKAQQQSGKGN